jgi:hypothetical protein
MVAHVDKVVQSSLKVAFPVTFQGLVDPTVKIDIGGDPDR